MAWNASYAYTHTYIYIYTYVKYINNVDVKICIVDPNEISFWVHFRVDLHVENLENWWSLLENLIRSKSYSKKWRNWHKQRNDRSISAMQNIIDEILIFICVFVYMCKVHRLLTRIFFYPLFCIGSNKCNRGGSIGIEREKKHNRPVRSAVLIANHIIEKKKKKQKKLYIHINLTLKVYLPSM